MQNRVVFAQDPTTFSIPNDGVTVVADPQSPEEWDVLRYELSSFVCDGEYREGLHRILSTYLAHLGKPKQPAVWVSGFYGSGKSHLVRVLQTLWNDVAFPDGAQARGLTKLPADITDLLAELSTAGKREGGLWTAAGKLGAGHASIQLDVLKVVLRSAGLPVQFAPARLVIWLKQKGIYDAVRAGVEQRGGVFEHELQNMYVSQELAESIFDANPGVAQSPLDISELLVAQYPDRTEIDDDLMLQSLEDVLRLQSSIPGKLPLTLLVFDELQQSIGEEPDRALAVQRVVEDCSSHFGSRILFVATGQAALEATPQLSKLQDRFTVRVSLEDKDVEQVVRQVVLRKQPDKVAAIQNVLDAASGEINRHLAGTKIGPTLTDSKDLVPDYPLLPTRRRFWERTLRAIDRAGTAAQLRTQLRVVHEANRSVANRPVGTVVGADILYDQQKSAMLSSGVLLREVAGMIDDQRRNGSTDGDLRARLCALIFLLGELPTEGVAVTGVRATAETLADLLVEDLTAGSGALRQQIPPLLQQLVDDGPSATTRASPATASPSFATRSRKSSRASSCCRAPARPRAAMTSPSATRPRRPAAMPCRFGCATSGRPRPRQCATRLRRPVWTARWSLCCCRARTPTSSRRRWPAGLQPERRWTPAPARNPRLRAQRRAELWKPATPSRTAG